MPGPDLPEISFVYRKHITNRMGCFNFKPITKRSQAHSTAEKPYCVSDFQSLLHCLFSPQISHIPSPPHHSWQMSHNSLGKITGIKGNSSFSYLQIYKIHVSTFFGLPYWLWIKCPCFYQRPTFHFCSWSLLLLISEALHSSLIGMHFPTFTNMLQYLQFLNKTNIP